MSDTLEAVEETVTIPLWAWESMVPVLREALTFWYSPGWLPSGPIPVDCFQYDVPVPLGDDPAPSDVLKQWFGRRRGDTFIPLYRATSELASVVMGDDSMCNLIGVDKL